MRYSVWKLDGREREKETESERNRERNRERKKQRKNFKFLYPIKNQTWEMLFHSSG
jgi:hypothetical protein